ncbi:hypothetical protein DESA109040_19155 [Deinococcus saxicola]|uniref:hypothetical protein n=1 Tax=Deinococcus saxicola TaxID=249406 RepID=UPI0039F11DFC
MNNAVYYAPGRENAPGTVTLSGPKGVACGPLDTFKALAAESGVRGAALLVMRGELSVQPVPENVKPEYLGPLLGARTGGVTMFNPATPGGIVASVEAGDLGTVTAAARAAGIRLSELRPLAACALCAAGVPSSAVVIVSSSQGYDIDIIAPGEAASRTQARNERSDLGRVITSACARLLSAGNSPTVILIGHDGPVPPTELSIKSVGIEHILGTLDTLGGYSGPFKDLVGAALPLSTRRNVDRALLVTLGLAAVINAGVWGAAQVVSGQVRALEARQGALQRQADDAARLRAGNDQLSRLTAQARALTENKGPLAADLPLLAGRMGELSGGLQSLSGPSPLSSADTRAFGQQVTRAYDLSALTPDPQAVARLYQERGLVADVRDVDCSASPCKVNFRAAPVITPAARPPTSSSLTEATP